MIPKSLSATSAGAYEACPSRWEAEFLNKAPQPTNSAAALGTSDHSALEWWIKEGYHKNPPADPHATMRELYEKAYVAEFGGIDMARYDEGLELALRWLDRQDWTNRTVLSTEQKLSFDIPTSIGPIPFNYIMDRCDEIASPLGRVIEVIDYKTLFKNVTADSLKTKIQPRCYALAAQMLYPDAQRIWVTFDMLRYDAVGCVFTIEENRDTYRYLCQLAERIIADDDPQERLNTDCRWCIRKHQCESLSKHIAAGGVLSIQDPNDAADRRFRLDAAKAAIEIAIAELDEFILTHCEREDIGGWSTTTTKVELGASSRRSIDPQRVATVVGNDLVAGHAKLTMAVIDSWLKPANTDLTAEQKAAVKRLITRNEGDLKVKTSAITPFD